MPESDADSTDGTSIKPVSSLRSHFESMSNSRLAPEVTLTNVAPKQLLSSSQGQRDSLMLERASIDVPRMTSPFSVSRDSFIEASQQIIQKPGESDSRSQRAGSSLEPRPTPTRSLSQPRFGPIAIGDLSRSSPDPFLLPAKQHPSRPSPASSSRSIDSRSRSPKDFPTPPGRLSDGSQPLSLNVYLLNKDRNAQQDVFQGESACGGGGSNFMGKNIRKPIKDSEKPKVPNKPNTAQNNNNISSRSNITESSKEIPAFVTPPSSDESPEQRSTGTHMVHDSRYFPQNSIEDTRKGYIRPSIHSSARKEQLVGGENSGNDALAVGAFQKGDARSPISPDGLIGNRPGLPPRREIDKRLQKPSVPVPAPRLDRMWSEKNEGQKSVRLRTQQPFLSDHSHLSPNSNVPLSDFRPPPKRTQTSVSHSQTTSQTDGLLPGSGIMGPKGSFHSHELDVSSTNQLSEYPETSAVNRRPPYFNQGIQKVDTFYDTKIFDLSSQYICTTGYLTKAWDLFSGELIMNISYGEKELRATAMAFKPEALAENEGRYIWLGTNHGDLHEVDILTQTKLFTKTAAHNRREIIKIYRCQESMWTLDDEGKLYVWPPDDRGCPDLRSVPYSRKVPKGHTFSLIIQENLWLATGKDIRIFRPNAIEDVEFVVNREPLNQPGVGEVTSGAIIPCQLHLVYFGHADGKITMYSTANFNCLGVFNVSAYKINTLAGAGSYLWAGYSTGMIFVYNTDTQPWSTKKEWQAHENPVVSILTHGGSNQQSGILRVASIGTDNTVRLWDGLLEHDWLETDMQDHDIDYCSFREINARVMTWNAGASTPAGLRYDEKNMNFFRETLQVKTPPDLLVFGFQELVDLEDKKLTAKSLFKGNKKKDPLEQEHMSRQYRAWRDYLVRCVEDAMPSDEPYHLLHSASMVGLFFCVFVKSSERNHIKNVSAAEIKRGMGGRHGNKGALVLRFVLDDSSLCLVNCHLAAGQTQTIHRNSDAAAILEASILTPERDPLTRCDTYVGGGDGSMIFDHEICILNGDLNYRIDTMGRDTVIKAIDSQNYTRLLERDQLLVSRRRNPGFRLRAFNESPILFAPTYKYDLNSNQYDTSEKHRAPAWCDRILYRGSGNIKQTEYRRHELQISDHRPVSAIFVIRIKKVLPNKRDMAWKSCKTRFEMFKTQILNIE